HQVSKRIWIQAQTLPEPSRTGHFTVHRLEDGYAFDVVGHSEEIEGAQGRDAVAEASERLQVPGQRRRVARDVRHPARPECRDPPYDVLPGAGPGRVQDGEV